jgi:hypothetical protein
MSIGLVQIAKRSIRVITVNIPRTESVNALPAQGRLSLGLIGIIIQGSLGTIEEREVIPDVRNARYK